MFVYIIQKRRAEKKKETVVAQQVATAQKPRVIPAEKASPPPIRSITGSIS